MINVKGMTELEHCNFLTCNKISNSVDSEITSKKEYESKVSSLVSRLIAEHCREYNLCYGEI